MSTDTKGAGTTFHNDALNLGVCGHPVSSSDFCGFGRGRALTTARQIKDIRARTGTFPRPGTLFATTLKRKVSAMSVSLPAPVIGCKIERAEGLQ